jgi:uncharacterized protein YdiU (UPF0061 family)
MSALFGSRIDNSYMRELTVDPGAARHAPNTSTREVDSGHYVPVQPKAIESPYLVLYSEDLAQALGLEQKALTGEPESVFVRVFSGDLQGDPGLGSTGWATPYALSIYGDRISPSPNAGPRGYGYGDGRAISIAEVLLPRKSGEADGGGGGGGGEGGAPSPPGRLRLELQLKGAGPTPFRRGGDGFAVLRSSLREFLASEAMHHLGVPTTRALSLVASDEEGVVRGWYSNTTKPSPELNARGGGAEMDIAVTNRRAITTRVARSFLRVGQFELYGRRAERAEPRGREELTALVRHAVGREFPELLPPAPPASPEAPLEDAAVLAFLGAVGKRLARMVAEWMRVGYVQSNFNSDNCLVGGYTMDYGPFGFLERYNPRFCMWSGGGDKYSYINQPQAAAMNFVTLIKSCLPLIVGKRDGVLEQLLSEFSEEVNSAMAGMWARKLGFPPTAPPDVIEQASAGLQKLLVAHPTDFTIALRQLIKVLPEQWEAEGGAEGGGGAEADACPAEALLPLALAFYDTALPPSKGQLWRTCECPQPPPPPLVLLPAVLKHMSKKHFTQTPLTRPFGLTQHDASRDGAVEKEPQGDWR